MTARLLSLLLAAAVSAPACDLLFPYQRASGTGPETSVVAGDGRPVGTDRARDAAVLEKGPACTSYPCVVTVAGSGVPGPFVDGVPPLKATLYWPHHAVSDAGVIYVADEGHHAIQKIADGKITTLAGRPGSSGATDGTGMEARFYSPHQLALLGNLLYVADAGNNAIRTVDIGTGAVKTLPVDKPLLISGPEGVAVTEGRVFVASTKTNQIVEVRNGAAVVVAGKPGSSTQCEKLDLGMEYSATNVSLRAPEGLAVAASRLFVAEHLCHRVLVLDTANANLALFAGSPLGTAGNEDGLAQDARFHLPMGVALDPKNGALVIAEFGGHRIRKVSNATVTTLAGSPLLYGPGGFRDGPGKQALFNRPAGVFVESDGNILVADEYNNRVRRILIQAP